MFKVCSRCEQEYQSWATECIDCHVPLNVEPELLASGEAAAPSTRPVPPLEDLVVLRLGEPWELQGFAELLQRQGIPSEIDTHPRGSAISGSARLATVKLGIYVGRSDLKAARAITEELAARHLSDAGAAPISTDPSTCPACGEPTPENAAACSACGLEFPEVPAEGT